MHLVAVFPPTAPLVNISSQSALFQMLYFPLRVMLLSRDTKDLLLVEGDHTCSLTKMFTVSKSGCPLSSLHHFPKEGNQVMKPSTCQVLRREVHPRWSGQTAGRLLKGHLCNRSIRLQAGAHAKDSLRLIFVVWPCPGKSVS